MDIKVAWWNTGLAPPATRAKKRTPAESFFLTVSSLMVNRQVDILGLCEMDGAGISALVNYLEVIGRSDIGVVSLYEKRGNSIDDICLVYNLEKVTPLASHSSLVINDPVTEASLRIGVWLPVELLDGTRVALILCHWQSRITYPANSAERDKLGITLRSKIDELLKDGYSIIVCGDFNDEPFDRSIEHFLAASRDVGLVRRKPKMLFNPYWNCLGSLSTDYCPPGTCLHEGVAEMTHSKTFDQIIFSSDFLSDRWQFEGMGASIVHDPLESMATPKEWRLDNSDHYPIVSHLKRIL